MKRSAFPLNGPDPRNPDPGDSLDVAKDPRRAWDFSESGLAVFKINKHVYMATTAQSALKLCVLRDLVDDLCKNIIDDYMSWSGDRFMLKRVAVFLDIHAFNKYTLNEIPAGTRFDGMNKPRDRYIAAEGPGIGMDGKIRASRRDIFLNLKKSRKNLELLLVHELAHTLANHVTFREDDHNADFIRCEKFIKIYWPRNSSH